MSDAYHRARRSYGLFAGLLIAWELIGFEIGPATLKSYDIVVKSPQAAPYVLVALVAYFSFRTTIEWLQCKKERRLLKVSVVDIVVSHGLGTAAILLYGVQLVLSAQIVDIVTLSGVWFLFTMISGGLFGYIWTIVLFARQRWQSWGKMRWVYLVILGLLFPMTVLVLATRDTGNVPTAPILAFLFGLSLFILCTGIVVLALKVAKLIRQGD